MKSSKTTFSSVVKNILPAAFAVLFFITSTPFTAKADDTKPAPSVAIKYLGEKNSQPQFRIALANPNEEVLFLTLKDEFGNVLYTEKLTDKAFNKTFQFNRPEMSDLNVTLIIQSKTEKKTQVYSINKQARLVEDVVVTEVH